MCVSVCLENIKQKMILYLKKKQNKKYIIVYECQCQLRRTLSVFIDCIMCQVSFFLTGSMPVVGSSRISTYAVRRLFNRMMTTVKERCITHVYAGTGAWSRM